MVIRCFLALLVFTLVPQGVTGFLCFDYVRPEPIKPGVARSFEIENLRDNLKLAGVAINPARPFTQADDVLRVQLYHHVYLARYAYPSAEALYEILVTRHSSREEFREGLQRWVKTHVSGMELIFPDEMMRFREHAIVEGKLREDGVPGLDVRGFIDPSLYNLMIKEGKFPIADPHDIISHLPSLADRSFVKVFRRYSALTYEFMRDLEFPDQYQLFNQSRDTEMVITSRSRALYRLTDFFTDVLRDFLPENFSFIINDSSGAPNFVFAGNKPWNGIIHLSGRDQANAPGLKGLDGFISRLSSDPSSFVLERFTGSSGFPLPLYKLPDFILEQKFMDQYDRLSDHLNPYDTLRTFRASLYEIAERHYSGDQPSARVMFKIIQQSAITIHEYPEAARAYSRAHRIKTFELMLDFFEAYRDWILEALPE